ncbi:hypothetical protein BDZ91DRAFT_724287 [Kalaharituber pfeilii]|nr:hypothetical protein BDZ91DRAFT_724287 [Kalaharituber pfeilii]
MSHIDKAEKPELVFWLWVATKMPNRLSELILPSSPHSKADSVGSKQKETPAQSDGPDDILYPIRSLLHLESKLALPNFTASTAYSLGTTIHKLGTDMYPASTIFISITSALTSPDAPPLILYQSCTGPDFRPDDMHRLLRKRNTVLRFGCSSFVMREKMRREDLTLDDKKNVELRSDSQGQQRFERTFGVDGRLFAASGGGVPIRVKGVDGIVGVVCVSGVTQAEDHYLAVIGLLRVQEGM